MLTSKTILYKEAASPMLVLCSLILFSALMPGMVFANGQNTQFIPGEVMVKFRQEAEPNQLLSQANQSNPPNIEILAPVALLLSGKTEIPLKVKQLLSGAWVLLTVDGDKLASQLVTQLRKRNTITDIQLRDSELKNVGTFEVKKIDVTFRSGSPEYKVVDAQFAGTTDDSFAGLIRELSKTLTLPCKGKVEQRGHLILQVDPREVTIELDKRLRSLSDLIELVQLNYISTRMR